MLHHFTLYRIMSYYIILSHTISNFFISYCIPCRICRHIVSYHIIYHIITFYLLIFHIVLYRILSHTISLCLISYNRIFLLFFLILISYNHILSHIISPSKHYAISFYLVSSHITSHNVISSYFSHTI